jgi:hypothetical protein
MDVFSYENGGQRVLDDPWSYSYYYSNFTGGAFIYSPAGVNQMMPAGYTFRDFYSAYLSSRDVDTFCVVVYSPVLDDLQLVVYDGNSSVGSVFLNPPAS